MLVGVEIDPGESEGFLSIENLIFIVSFYCALRFQRAFLLEKIRDKMMVCATFEE